MYQFAAGDISSKWRTSASLGGHLANTGRSQLQVADYFKTLNDENLKDISKSFPCSVFHASGSGCRTPLVFILPPPYS